MKKTLFSIIFVATACTFFACSNGDYNANPNSAANDSVNPMDLLDSAGFNWSGADAISAKVNGQYVHYDSTQVVYDFLSGTNIITAYAGISHGFRLSLSNVYGNNIYAMGYKITERQMQFSDSTVAVGAITYYSYFGNVGQVQIIRNDPTRIIGRFHFQALNQLGGTVINVSEGWFNVRKF